MNSRAAKARLLCSGSVMVLAIVGLGVRLALLHGGDHEETRDRFEASRSYERTILAGRGNIFDRRGSRNVLAMNLAVKDVCFDPKAVVEAEGVLDTASVLAETLDVATDELVVRMRQPDRRFAYARRFVHEEVANQVAALQLPGVFFRDEIIRDYPHHGFLCHVLGFVNHNGTGSAGIEQYLDRYLRGSPGVVEGRLNGLRQDLYVQRGRVVPALEGADVHLTIDQNVQYMVEKALDEAMAAHNAEGAWAIVQQVRTGDILAMASRPAFDLNAFANADNTVKLNRAIGYVYEPGSTLKPMVIAAALEEGTVTPSTEYDCENGAWMYGKRWLRDYHPYTRLTVADGIKKSSNILTAKVALTLGDDRLHDYLRRFGYGQRLNIDLPGEETGILHPVSRWSKISATRISIGQGIATTALQMVGAMCAIANDGFMMRPRIIREIRSATGEVMLRPEPEVLSRPISAQTAAVMRGLLSRVTETGGTGRRARVKGFSVAGKTGTAQKPIPGGYSTTDHMASFVGFLPAENPEIGIVVVVDNPQPLHTGGTVAAPVFRAIAGPAIRYLGVSGTHEMLAQR